MSIMALLPTLFNYEKTQIGAAICSLCMHKQGTQGRVLVLVSSAHGDLQEM